VVPRVVIDALAARFGGAAYASLALANALAARADIGEVILVARDGTIVAERVPPVACTRLIRLPAARRLELPRRLAWEALRLPDLLQDRRSAILTWSGMLPRSVRGHLVCYLANPLIFLEDTPGNRLRRLAARHTARRAEHVLAPTAGMADLAAPALGRRPDVVPLGVDHDRFQRGTSVGSDVLVLADFYPHKRHEIAIEAWKRLPSPRPRLRLIGDPRVAPAHARRIDNLAARARRFGDIVIESKLPPESIVEAFHRASVFLCPSVSESFCLPLAEALACGVPAVVRDLPSLLETGGPAASFVHGDDAADWAAALEHALFDQETCATAVARGVEHVARYRWERTAAELATRLAQP
jgi:glycosyltransferase involved in cell wall biosynthesis